MSASLLMPRRFSTWAALGFGFVALVWVGGFTPRPASAQDTPPDATAEAPSEDEITIEDTIVVTASRKEEALHDVPATVTVLTSEDLAEIPADDYGDILRNVPGLNVSQMSARDIQITGRGATNSLATSELVLLDNRTIYLDFFGFVMWDFLPVNPNEIKQVEVVRGPGSAVWGANATSGVINLITKKPKEMVGTSLLVGGGEIGTVYGSLTHATASEKRGFKVSAGYYEQDAYDRPSANFGLFTFSNQDNEGTSQPKVDLRYDFDPNEETTLSFNAGYAATDGIVHSGIGPFDIDKGANLGYFKADWARHAARVTFFANLLDADSTNLLTVDALTRNRLEFSFKTDTYNLDFANAAAIGEHNLISYGANVRQNKFDLTIASPQKTDRNEYGVYLQDEILLGDKVRWVIGARWDDLDVIDPQVSPRTTLVLAPAPNHTFRLSYNRAFRAPSAINNSLFATILSPSITVPGTPIRNFTYGIPAVGNPGAPGLAASRGINVPTLQEEKVDAYEVSYLGTFSKRTTFSLAVYRNKTTDSIDFFTTGAHTRNNPPPGWPAPLAFIIPLLPVQLPSGFSYRNIGETIDQGVELGIDARPSDKWSFFFNYSYQKEPETKGIEVAPGTNLVAVNVPPENRINAGVAYDAGSWFVNSNVNYVDEALWTDVLNIIGPTDSFTQANLSIGYRFAGDKATFSIIGSNIFDEDVQQHIFGDVISRKVSAQLLYRF